MLALRQRLETIAGGGADLQVVAERRRRIPPTRAGALARVAGPQGPRASKWLRPIHCFHSDLSVMQYPDSVGWSMPFDTLCQRMRPFMSTRFLPLTRSLARATEADALSLLDNATLWYSLAPNKTCSRHTECPRHSYCEADAQECRPRKVAWPGAAPPPGHDMSCREHDECLRIRRDGRPDAWYDDGVCAHGRCSLCYSLSRTRELVPDVGPCMASVTAEGVPLHTCRTPWNRTEGRLPHDFACAPGGDEGAACGWDGHCRPGLVCSGAAASSGAGVFIAHAADALRSAAASGGGVSSCFHPMYNHTGLCVPIRRRDTQRP